MRAVTGSICDELMRSMVACHRAGVPLAPQATEMGACAPALCTRRCRIWELGARGFQLGGRVVWPWPTPVRVRADIPHLGFLGPHPDPVDLQSAVIDRVRPLIAVAKVMTIFEMRGRSSFAAVFGAMTFMYFLFSSCRGFSRSTSPPAFQERRAGAGESVEACGQARIR